jgi:hypothetical protein
VVLAEGLVVVATLVVGVRAVVGDPGQTKRI